MKKSLAVLLIFFALVPSLAHAEHFTSLSSLQRFIMQHAPDQVDGTLSHTVTLSGTIIDLYSYNKSNHYEMLLQVDDGKAVDSFRYGVPVLVVHFRLHVDPVPFHVGDVIEVKGTLNALYSSPIMPWVLADEINGSSDF